MDRYETPSHEHQEDDNDEQEEQQHNSSENNINSSDDFSSSSNEEQEQPEQETVVMCTKCNIPLANDPVERRQHYKSADHVAKLLERVHASSPLLPQKIYEKDTPRASENDTDS